MGDVIITGASRGIGRALALALVAGPRTPTAPATRTPKDPLAPMPAPPSAGRALRLVLTARDESKLAELSRQVEAAGGAALCVPGDLSSLTAARALGARLAEVVQPRATLVHNAGLWPARRELTPDGLEASFVVNCVGPLLAQRALLERQLVDRIMVISAGLIPFGRYSPTKTPTGEDFSRWRTYCTTKLAFAIAERDLAARHPTIDVVVLHPGVVRTDLGARRGPLGFVLELAKRFQESPEVCARRLADLLAKAPWSPPGQPRWLWEDQERPWPGAADDPGAAQAVLESMERFLDAPRLPPIKKPP